MSEAEFNEAMMPRAKVLATAVDLWKQCNEGKPARSEEKLPLREIVARPDLFQVRGTTDAKHVADLADIIRSTEGDLDPLLLIELGEEAVVVNGHHRVAAYQAVYGESEPAHPVPVRWFVGNPVQALTKATGENSKTCLVMTREQRKDAATRLAGMVGTALSKAELSRVTGLSTTTIAEIRAGLKKVQALAAGDGLLRDEARDALNSLKWSDIQACVDLSEGAAEQVEDSEAEGVRFRTGETVEVRAEAVNAERADEVIAEEASSSKEIGHPEPVAPEQDTVQKFAALLVKDGTETIRQLLAFLGNDSSPLARAVFDQMLPITFLRAAGYTVRPQTADCLSRMPRSGEGYTHDADF